MRFIENGSDIPNELIEAQRKGELVFLCGAGISMNAACLPDFKKLTEDIYDQMGEDRESVPAERLAFGACEYDRALRSLEKRTTPSNSDVSEVRSIVCQKLSYQKGMDLRVHSDLLGLSVDSYSRPRVLTTNFDTLFERAMKAAKEEIYSHAVKSLPKSCGPKDFGVLHLHGRIEDVDIGVSKTDLVLTSADFGDAYLRDGWASRYLEDRVRQTPMVLIGYRAEDAALRLLLEALDADRDRFPDLKNIYAFSKPDEDEVSQWQAKGIIPIECLGHDELYKTIHEWSLLSQDPDAFCRERIDKIFEKSPEQVTPFEKEQLRALLEIVDEAIVLELNPSLAWVPFVLPRDKPLIKRKGFLADWVKQNFHNFEAIRDVVSNLGYFEKEITTWLKLQLNKEKQNMPPLAWDAWQAIMRCLLEAKDNDLWAEAETIRQSLQSGDLTVATIKKVVDLVTPKLAVGRAFIFGEEKEKKPEKITDLMDVRYKVDRDVVHRDLLSCWPVDATWQQEKLLLTRLDRSLSSAIEEAVSIGVETDDGYGITDSDVPSVANHPQNEHHYGFLPIIRAMADAWIRLAQKRPKEAVAFFKQWKSSEHKLYRRLALFAASFAVIPRTLAADLLLKLPQTELFLTGTTVEVFQLLKRRWSDFTPLKRAKIETRLRKGPPKKAFRRTKNIQGIVDRCIYDVLGRLDSLGYPLTEQTKQKLKTIKSTWPKWGLKPEEQDGFSSWISGVRAVSGEPKTFFELVSVLDNKLIEKAKELDRKDTFRTEVHWRALCKSYPERALKALEIESRDKRWPTDEWDRFLRCRLDVYSSELVAKTVALIRKCPIRAFDKFAMAVVDWLEMLGENIPDDLLWPVWEKVRERLAKIKWEDEVISFDHAINHPAGKLVYVLLRRSPKDSSPFATLFSRIEQLMHINGVFGLLTKVRLARDVSYLYDLNPEWVEQRFLPLFHLSEPDALHLWAGRKYAPYIGSPLLWKLMKDDFLKLFKMPQVSKEDLRIFSGWLPLLLLHNKKEGDKYSLTSKEARTALRQVGSSELSHVAHILAVEMEKTSKKEKTSYWRDVVEPVFKGIWPLDIEMRSQNTNFKLMHLLTSTGEAFSEAADVIIPYIEPAQEVNDISMHYIKTISDDLYSLAPKKILELANRIIAPSVEGRVYDILEVLDKIKKAEPSLEKDPLFQRLKQYA